MEMENPKNNKRVQKVLNEIRKRANKDIIINETTTITAI